MSQIYTRMGLPHYAIEGTEAARLIDAFVELMESYGVGIKPGSRLEHGILLHHQLAEYARRPAGFITADEGREAQEAMGVLHLASLVLRHAQHPDLRAILPHLKLLNEGSPAQTVPASIADQAANKLFELYVALATMAHGSEVAMDHPVHSSGGENPDILATMSDGNRWGFACKVIHGDSSQTLFENIAKGISQLRAARVRRGAVVVSLRNRIVHDQLLGVDGLDAAAPVRAAADGWDVGRWLTEHIDRRMHLMRSAVGIEALQELSGEEEWVVCVQAPAAFFVLTPTGMAPTFMMVLRPFELGLFAVGAPNLFLRREKARVIEELIGGLNARDEAG